MSLPARDNAAHVQRIMREIEDRVRLRLRRELMDKGGDPGFADRELFEAVERVLRRGVQRSELPAALLVPELISPEGEWRFEPAVRWSSHRPFIGRTIVSLKRRVLLPAMRWLYDYTRENFQRQDRVNAVLFSCLEQLAMENARLRRELERIGGPSDAEPADDPAG